MWSPIASKWKLLQPPGAVFYWHHGPRLSWFSSKRKCPCSLFLTGLFSSALLLFWLMLFSLSKLFLSDLPYMSSQWLSNYIFSSSLSPAIQVWIAYSLFDISRWMSYRHTKLSRVHIIFIISLSISPLTYILYLSVYGTTIYLVFQAKSQKLSSSFHQFLHEI